MYYGTTQDKAYPLQTMPHYTDESFRHGKTVFGKVPATEFGHAGLEYVYSDRLQQWDYDKAAQATEAAKASGHAPRSCLWYEAYLSAYFGKPVTIEHIVAGFNWSNGYPLSLIHI